MNESINLVEILKDCPKGTKLYTPLAGEVIFQYIRGDETYEIMTFNSDDIVNTYSFTKEGKYYNTKDGECTLFPSKDQRDWSKFTAPWYKKDKFDPKTLKPFDKVLIKEWGKWSVDFFSHISTNSETPYYCIGHFADVIIPYNEDTKHLVGTTDEAPEYYKYWEE